MDRRNFVFKTAASVGVVAVGACGGGSADSATLRLSKKRETALAPAPAPAPAPTLAPTPTSTVRQFLSWDGGSGPSRDFWSQKLQLPWVNKGSGDWLDARQMPQGTVPYASTMVYVGRVEIDVTALVNRWINSGENRGFYLRSGQDWAYSFAGRNNSLLSARPQLQLVSASGTSTRACSCNAMWSPSTYQGRDSRETFSVAKGAHFAAVQFDLSTLTEPVTRATLQLTCMTLKYPGLLEVFELNPPQFRVGGGALAPQTGLARDYLFDRGLGAHPGVVFAGDFSDLSKARWQAGGVASGTSQVPDARTGTTYLRGLIPENELWGCDLERVVAPGTPSGVPAQTETELYGRYYVYLEEDWGSERDANKMPGWDGRFGWWNPLGYWQNTTGNGGARPTGLKVRNTTYNRWEYEGASMRGHGGTRLNDGNPYDDLFWLGSYLYHLDQASAYGETVKWSGVVIGRGRWHCIEQYIKMNSITGPFDAIGNGVAVHDGEFKVWVDGVPAYARTNFRWRRHPEMGVQGFWLNWYHGGTLAAPSTMHFRMDSVAIARHYIGPRQESL